MSRVFEKVRVFEEASKSLHRSKSLSNESSAVESINKRIVDIKRDNINNEALKGYLLAIENTYVSSKKTVDDQDVVQHNHKLIRLIKELNCEAEEYIREILKLRTELRSQDDLRALHEKIKEENRRLKDRVLFLENRLSGNNQQGPPDHSTGTTLLQTLADKENQIDVLRNVPIKETPGHKSCPEVVQISPIERTACKYTKNDFQAPPDCTSPSIDVKLTKKLKNVSNKIFGLVSKFEPNSATSVRNFRRSRSAKSSPNVNKF